MSDKNLRIQNLPYNFFSLVIDAFVICKKPIISTCIINVYHKRYLGVNIVASRQFRVSTGDAKRSFYRAANGIFGKIGRIASEEVVLQLIKSKCIPALLYGLEACPLKKSRLTFSRLRCEQILYEIIQY